MNKTKSLIENDLFNLFYFLKVKKGANHLYLLFWADGSYHRRAEEKYFLVLGVISILFWNCRLSKKAIQSFFNQIIIIIFRLHTHWFKCNCFILSGISGCALSLSLVNCGKGTGKLVVVLWRVEPWSCSKICIMIVFAFQDAVARIQEVIHLFKMFFFFFFVPDFWDFSTF